MSDEAADDDAPSTSAPSGSGIGGPQRFIQHEVICPRRQLLDLASHGSQLVAQDSS